MVENKKQIETATPVFFEIGIQNRRMSQVIIHDGSGHRCRTMDTFAILEGNTGGEQKFWEICLLSLEDHLIQLYRTLFHF